MYLILARNPILLVLSATKFSMLRNVYYITFNQSHKKNGNSQGLFQTLNACGTRMHCPFRISLGIFLRQKL